MVQEYKNTDLDLFQKIDLTNPKDELLKKIRQVHRNKKTITSNLII